MKGRLFASVCALGLLAAAAPALAQTTGSKANAKPSVTDVGEVIVTSTRRTERLQDIPLSVTAYSQETLTAKGIVGYEGLAQETPGVVLNRPSANFNNFTARGIATNGYGANLQSTVAVYIDELPISTIGNTTVLDPNLFDVERVEFLRGPQGTLFGSGSLSGALRILTKKPNLTQFGASVLADIGVIGPDSLRQRYNGMINVPLVQDKLALRAVGFYRNEEGYIDNVGLTNRKNSNDLDAWGGRVQLLWAATDRTNVKLLASREISKPRDSSTVSPALGHDKRVSDRPDLFQGWLTSFNATVEHQFDGAQLTSSSTYSKFNQKFYVDLGGTFGNALGAATGIAFALDADAYQDTFVQEARLVSDPGGKWDWVVGGFYLDRRIDVDYNYRSRPDYLAFRGFTGLPDEYYQRFGNHTNSQELAGFGEVTYRFSDRMWVTGGLRYGGFEAQTITEGGGYNSNYLTAALTPGFRGPLTITPIAAARGVKAKESGPSWKLSVSYKPSSAITTYATVSTGFRTPVVNGFAGRTSVVNPSDIVIPAGADSDDLTNYEIGLKGRWLNGRLTTNLAAYWIDWENIQVQANRVSDSVQFATNIGKAVSRGLEFEVVALPADGLSVGVNGAFNEAEVTKLSPTEAAISGAGEGVRLASPRFQGSAFFNYGFDLTPDARANLSTVVSRVGKFPGMFPYIPGRPGVLAPTYAYTQAYTNVNATFAVAYGQATFAAYVENLFNSRKINYVHPEAFIASRFAEQRPRTVGVRFGYDF
ncbi:MAG: TonB-dependent receptor [Alphaproteobacteria bacterium]|nr:TonB-dependent receptor [Alphaproteobacteria bacterium]MBU1513036.1 TonB-dependent receptor [Alphaproteobacteria bacterium]MBU2095144.1 TonB-dependent receptor [Alphaproteobacteria bacterium]MBU2152115.1 TonB-dependent receptor [Alphaproteobacteria bacterium]MBU2306395.1 TonB-dependent receptor [Alphaproteobacteria bacterium]